ncbi:protein BPS1, chloroplastic-like [Euphorbia lathyris]|uniref:protein BPS1, chloroplastic-like n=1 Tax=Euphorbia lathyris TaxID=212925 RepID=UPI0033139B39
MVLSVHRFTKFYSKIDHHHHHHRPEALPASLQAFRSDVSTCITQLICNLKPGFEISWIHQCFQLLPVANKAFAKLVVDIDYRMTNWQARSMEDYLNYTLDLLDLFNSITASISHLSHVRLSMLHALSLLQTSPCSAVEKMKAIAFNSPRKEIDRKQGEKERCCSDKESVIVQALIELRSIGLWVCRVVLAILSGDEEIYTQMRKSEGELSSPALVNLDLRVGEILLKKGCSLKEVKELKELSNACGEAIEIEMKLEEFEKQLNDIGKQVDRVFSQVLAGRNELLSGIRFRK